MSGIGEPKRYVPSSPVVSVETVADEIAKLGQKLAALSVSMPSPPPPPSPFIFMDDAESLSAAAVRKYLRNRRLREKMFPAELFADPAWDILLDLYAAGIERKQVSVSSACIAAAVAPTTALRWLARLTEMGLVERTPDPEDARRCIVCLSHMTHEAMRRWVDACFL